MKKIALLLAALLVLGMLAGCNAEEEKTPDHMVPGYDIGLYTGEGWTVAEESDYDLQLSKSGVTMYVMGFTVMDFVDMPAAEDLYLECNEDLFEDKTDLSVKEKESSYEKNGKKLISTLFSAKSGEETRQYYCFMVSFTDEAESKAWVCFSATEKVMKQKKAELKTIAETMDANGEYISPEEMEELLEDAMYADGVEEELEDDYVEDPTPTDAAAGDVPAGEGSEMDKNPETTEPQVESEETKPAEEETSEPADEKDAPDATTASTEATATTEAATEATE